jgi:hypothetical protein
MDSRTQSLQKLGQLTETDNSAFLWISGNPGCGNTVLSKFLIDSIETSLNVRGLTRQHVLYFFFDDKYDKQKTATSFTRALLHQLIRLVPSLITYATPEYLSHGPEVMFQSLDTLWKIFLAAIADGKLLDGAYLVINALDECQESSRELLSRYFEDYFATKSPAKDSDSTTFLKVLVTSRPYPGIEGLLKPSFCTRLITENDEGKINRDIISFIADQTEHLRSKGYSDCLIQEVRKSLTIKADGMFLWVSLIIEDLIKTPVEVIQSRLKSLPSGLSGLYQQLLDELGRDQDSQDGKKNFDVGGSCTVTDERARTCLGIHNKRRS